MTISEILLVFCIAIILIKPEDIPGLVKHIKRLIKYFRALQKEVMDHFDDVDDAEEMNLYIEKIASMNHKYEGEYDVVSVKSYYHKLIKKQSKQQLDDV